MNSFDMALLFDMLQVPGSHTDLLLRSFGQRAFPILEQKLNEVPSGGTLVLDFAKIRVMDTSFADETVVQLAVGLREGRYGDKFLIVDNPVPATVENLEGALARRKEKTVLLIRQETGIFVINHLEPNLAKTWNFVLKAGTMTARDFADQMNIEIGAASMRLGKLHQAGVLARREEITSFGKQHIYTLPS